MLHDDGEFADALGAGGADVVLVHGVQDIGARQACDGGGINQTEGHGGHDIGCGLAKAGNGQPFQRQAEDELEDDRDPEAGRGHAERGDQHDETVCELAVANRREGAHHHPQQHRKEQHPDRKRAGDGKRLCNQRDDGLFLEVGVAEIPCHGVFDKAEVLGGQRIVQAHLVADALNGRLVRLLLQHDGCGIAGNDIDHDKGDQRHADQHDNGLKQPFQCVS